MSVKIEFHFESVKKAQDFLNNLNNVPAANVAVSPSDVYLTKPHPAVVDRVVVEDGVVVGHVVEGAPDFAAVKQAVLSLSQAKSSDIARAVLKQFNDKNGKPCEKVTAVAESDYVKLMAAVKEAMA